VRGGAGVGVCALAAMAAAKINKAQTALFIIKDLLKTTVFGSSESLPCPAISDNETQRHFQNRLRKYEFLKKVELAFSLS
jgi:hypothetical protein